MATAEPSISEQWDIVKYEAEMLFELYKILDDPTIHPKNKYVANAIVESACLHARILIEFLISKGTDDDDILLNRLASDFSSTSVDSLKRVYGKRKDEHSPCWILNKMLAHPTKNRMESYDYEPLLMNLLPHIRAVWDELQKHMPNGRMLELSANVGTRFCATTNS